MSRERTPHRASRRTRLRVERLEDRTVPTVFTPAQVTHAYGFDQIVFPTAAGGTVAGDGSGQTIAIVDAYDDPNIASDLHYFDQTFGLADPPSFTKVMQTGTVADAGWAGEIALDVEWAHAVAPGANILLVEAKSSSLSDLLSAVDYAAAQPGVGVVSMSWGGSEWSGEHAYDSHFVTPAGHQGVTFVASAGDDGARPAWPSVSPNVLSVGGTSLTLSGTGGYQSETTWRWGGGGTSRYESQPTYQSYVPTGSAKRSTPDVAYNADPNTGVYVYDSYNGGWYAVGGTSAGAPQWSALVAIADQGRALAGKTTLDGASQTLYAVYRMAQSGPATYFHDVTTGSNGTKAKTGYDDATGNGSPIADRVVGALVGWNGATGTGSLGSGGAAAGAVIPTGGRRASPQDLATVVSVFPAALPPELVALPTPPFSPVFNPPPVTSAPAEVRPPGTPPTSTDTSPLAFAAPPELPRMVPPDPLPPEDSPLDWGWPFSPRTAERPIELKGGPAKDGDDDEGNDDCEAAEVSAGTGEAEGEGESEGSSGGEGGGDE